VSRDIPGYTEATVIPDLIAGLERGDKEKEGGKVKHTCNTINQIPVVS